MNRGCTGHEPTTGMSRRGFLNRFGMGLGALALADLVNPAKGLSQSQLEAGDVRQKLRQQRDLRIGSESSSLDQLHHFGRAKRVIFLFQSGAPSQIDLLDHKPLLTERHGTELPEEVRRGQRLTAMSGNQASRPLVGSPFKFAQHGDSGAWLSELLPHTAGVADELCLIKSLHTEAINHGPAVTYIQTGSQFPGRPSMGAWLDFGLGSENENLPAFVVLVTKNKGGQPLVARLWGSGFLPSKHQGVRFRSGPDPVLYLNNPAGIEVESRRSALDALHKLHHLELEKNSDPQIEMRIAQYELAYRMQMTIPEATALMSEPDYIFREYGEDSRSPGTYAANCLQARRLAERGVRFIQLFHPGWDHHGGLPAAIRKQCQETDQATAALIRDLKRRGLLDDTLVIWGGEFGRTNYCQGKLTVSNFGRDHHPRCFTIWMAGGGVRGGMTYGETDPYSYNVAADAVHIHDLQATILHLLGIDHERLTFKYQGRHFRLTDVHGQVIEKVLA